MGSKYIGVMTLTYWRHDLDLAGSRDDVSHVIIRIPVCHFLLVVPFPSVL